MKGVLCFDYDMTLLDHATGKVPESALRGIELLRPDWKIAIATGRDMRQPESRYGMDAIRPDALIHMNGAQVQADGELLYEFYWPRRLQRSLLAFAGAHHICAGCVLDGVYYATEPETLRRFVRTVAYQQPAAVLPIEALPDRPVNAFAMVGTPEDAAQIEAAFPQVRVPLFAQKQGADIIPQSLSKAQGMRHVLSHYGMDFGQVVFFGDSGNDLELIREAGVGVAMGNAIPALKAAADYVTDAIGSDGIWNALAHLGLLR